MGGVSGGEWEGCLEVSVEVSRGEWEECLEVSRKARAPQCWAEPPLMD